MYKQWRKDMKTLKVLDDKGKPSGSRWKVISLDQLNYDIYRIKDQRASSYIDLPDKKKFKDRKDDQVILERR